METENEIIKEKDKAKQLIDEAKAWLLITDRGETLGISMHGGRTMLFTLVNTLNQCKDVKALIEAALIIERGCMVA